MKQNNEEVIIADEELAELELLAAYLDGNTTPAETRKIDAAIRSNKRLRATVELFNDVRVFEEEYTISPEHVDYAEALRQFETWLSHIRQRALYTIL